MLSEKEKKIIQALIEEEMACINISDNREELSILLSDYRKTLENILSKLNVNEPMKDDERNSHMAYKII